MVHQKSLDNTCHSERSEESALKADLSAASRPRDDIDEMSKSVGFTTLAAKRLSTIQNEQLSQFARMVWEKAVPLGLSGRASLDEIVRKDIEDSLTLMPHLLRCHSRTPLRVGEGFCHSRTPFLCGGESGNLSLEKPLSLLDIGPGAGFPGIPLKIVWPEISLSLLEAKQKAVKFLEEVVQELSLTQVTVTHGRAEEFKNKPPWKQAFDVVVGRAVAPAKEFLQWAAPFLKPGGCLILQKGKRWEQEFKEAEPQLKRLKLHVESISPGLEGGQKIIALRK